MTELVTELYERLDNQEEVNVVVLTETGYMLYSMVKSDIANENFTIDNLENAVEEIVESLEENIGEKVLYVLLATSSYEPHEGELDSDNEWGHLLN